MYAVAKHKKKFVPKNKMFNEILTHMRQVLVDAGKEAKKTMNRSERMRDDDAMLLAAEAKRQRKMDRMRLEDNKNK